MNRWVRSFVHPASGIEGVYFSADRNGHGIELLEESTKIDLSPNAHPGMFSKAV